MVNFEPSNSTETEWFDYLEYHLLWACPLSCGILLFGTFGNLVTIGMFQHKMFARMRLTYYLGILCGVNICFVFAETLKVFSCNLDYQENTQKQSGNVVCLWITWFATLFDFIIHFIMICITFNRFKSQGKPDYTKNTLEAIRQPIVVTATMVALFIIPSRVYQEAKMEEIVTLTDHRCSYLYIFPYHADSADYSALTIFIMCNVITCSLLLAFFIRVVYNVRRNKNFKRKSSQVAFTSTAFPNSAGPSSTITDDFDMDNPKGGDDLSHTDSNSLSLNRSDQRTRRKAVTRMTVVLVIGFIIVSTPRFLLSWPYVKHPFRMDLFVLFMIVADIAYMMFLSSNFAIFYISNQVFGSIIVRFYKEEPMVKTYTDLPLAIRMKILPSNSVEEKELFDIVNSSEAASVSTAGRSSTLSQKRGRMNSAMKTILEFNEAVKKYVIEDFTTSNDRLRLEHVTPRSLVVNPNQVGRSSVAVDRDAIYKGFRSSMVLERNRTRATTVLQADDFTSTT